MGTIKLTCLRCLYLAWHRAEYEDGEPLRLDSTTRAHMEAIRFGHEPEPVHMPACPSGSVSVDWAHARKLFTEKASKSSLPFDLRPGRYWLAKISHAFDYFAPRRYDVRESTGDWSEDRVDERGQALQWTVLCEFEVLPTGKVRRARKTVDAA